MSRSRLGDGNGRCRRRVARKVIGLARIGRRLGCIRRSLASAPVRPKPNCAEFARDLAARRHNLLVLNSGHSLAHAVAGTLS